MELTLLTGAIAALLSSAAGEAGKSAWSALKTMVRRRFGDSTNVDQATGEQAGEIAQDLLDRAAADPDFADELNRWFADTTTVVNIISGNAQVNKSIQMGTNYGPINM